MTPLSDSRAFRKETLASYSALPPKNGSEHSRVINTVKSLLNFGRADMFLLQIWTCEPLSAAGANSLDFSLMCLVHVASEATVLDESRTSGPSALYFSLIALHIWEREVLIPTG
jgi:hypothetical protein